MTTKQANLVPVANHVWCEDTQTIHPAHLVGMGGCGPGHTTVWRHELVDSVDVDDVLVLVGVIESEVDAALRDCKARNVNPHQELTKQGIEWFSRCRQLMGELKDLPDSPTVTLVRERVNQAAKKVGRHTIGLQDPDVLFRE